MTSWLDNKEVVCCEHLEEADVRNTNIAWGIPYFIFSLSNKKYLVLCQKCQNALAYEMVTRFNKDSSYVPMTSYPYGGK